MLLSRFCLKECVLFPVLCLTRRCIACVSRPWACQWNTADHTCSDMNDAETGPNIIKHRQVRKTTKPHLLIYLVTVSSQTEIYCCVLNDLIVSQCQDVIINVRDTHA